VPAPHAGANQVRIRVGAASVNPIDWKIRAGHMAEMMPQEFPAIPGLDAAGIVDEVGEGTTGVANGDRVFGLAAAGASAEHVVLSAWASVPNLWTTRQAAGAAVAGATAIRVLDLLDLKAGETLLIEGAAGGVGSAVAQIASARAIKVIGTASAANHAFLAELHVTPVTYGTGLAYRVAANAPGGVDAALDTVGSGSLAELISIVGNPGKVVSIADFSASSLGAIQDDGTEGNPAEALQEISRLGAAGLFTAHVSATFPLDQINKAHELSQTGHGRGKIIVTF